MVLLPEVGGRMSKHVGETTLLLYTYIQGVPGGNVNILWGHNIAHSKQQTVYVCVSYCELFPRYSYFTVPEFGFGAQYCPSLPPYCATVWNMRISVKRQLADVSGYKRRTARSRNGCYRQHKGTSRCTQTSNKPCPHKRCKMHWGWWWNFRKCIVLGKLYQLCHLNNNTGITNNT